MRVRHFRSRTAAGEDEAVVDRVIGVRVTHERRGRRRVAQNRRPVAQDVHVLDLVVAAGANVGLLAGVGVVGLVLLLLALLLGEGRQGVEVHRGDGGRDAVHREVGRLLGVLLLLFRLHAETVVAKAIGEGLQIRAAVFAALVLGFTVALVGRRTQLRESDRAVNQILLSTRANLVDVVGGELGRGRADLDAGGRRAGHDARDEIAALGMGLARLVQGDAADRQQRDHHPDHDSPVQVPTCRRR